MKQFWCKFKHEVTIMYKNCLLKDKGGNDMKKVLAMGIAIFCLYMFSACGSSIDELSEEELVVGLKENASEVGFNIDDIAYYYDKEEEDIEYNWGGDYHVDMTVTNNELSEEEFGRKLSELSEEWNTIWDENECIFYIMLDKVTFKDKVYMVDVDNSIYDEDWNIIFDPNEKDNGKKETTAEATTQATTEDKTSDDSMKKVKDEELKTHIWVCAQDVASQSLKSPRKAKFCSINEAEVYSLGNKQYMAMGYVDAQNTYGAEIR